MGLSNDLVRFLFDLASAVLLLVVALGGRTMLTLKSVRGVVCFAGAWLPRFLEIRGGRSFAFQLGNMLSAGVMLSACFCHLLAAALPETEKAIPRFPLAPFLCALGCLLTLAADQYATYISGGHAHKRSPTLLQSGHVSSEALQEIEGGHSPSKQGVKLESAAEWSNGLQENQDAETEGMVDGAHQVARVSFLTALFLGLALSLHSLLEGLALGAQQTIHATRDVLIAIAAHKGLAAYALGASLVDSKTSSSRFWKVAWGFSLASPIGILVGYALSEVSNGVGAASLSALASGTFLYVALMEVIPGELKNSEHVTSKLAVMFLGFGAMSTLAIWA